MTRSIGSLTDMYAHTNCQSFTTNDENSMIETISLLKGAKVQRMVSCYEIVLVTSGRIHLYCKGSINEVVPRRKFFMLPPGGSVTYKAEEPTYIVICRLDNNVNYCHNFGKLTDAEKERIKNVGFFALGFKKPVVRFVESLAVSVENGLLCKPYLTAKYTELMFLLRGYYSKLELAAFFKKMNGNDPEFRANVYKYVGECSTVKELAERLHMSDVGLRKKFVREFGIPPMEFIIDRRKAMILGELVEGGKSIRQISEEYGFASQNCFTHFCKVYLGDTPTGIRKKNRELG